MGGSPWAASSSSGSWSNRAHTAVPWGGHADRASQGGLEVEDLGRGRKRPAPRDYEDDGRPASKKITVKNIPRGLGIPEMKEAFEAMSGRIASCQIERGQAWITFHN